MMRCIIVLAGNVTMAEDLISRPYQEQLEEIASTKNTIIHLPTGSGKTFIAVCLIRRLRAALQKPWGEGGKRTFFLVNTVPLVKQQKSVIEDLCPVKGVGAYCGESGVDHWDNQKWNQEMANHQVIVMTCQILSDMLNHSYIKIDDINLLIFDECHHAVDDHPMRLIMKHFESCPSHKQPRVLGLTATLLNANVTIGQVESSLKELETTFHATIATVNELGEVLTYSTNPMESVQYYDKPAPTATSAAVNTILDNAVEFIQNVKLPVPARNQELKLNASQTDITTDAKKLTKAVKNMMISIKMLMEELGEYGGCQGSLAYIILLERLKRRASSKQERDLYDMAIIYITRTRDILLNNMQNETGYNQIMKYSSQKVLLMLNILKEYNPNNYNKPGVLLKTNLTKKPLSAIIFTQQRFTAKIVYNIIKAAQIYNPDEFGFIKHDFIVGFSTNPLKCTREQHYLAKASHKSLLKFGRNELNCLISTSVIEEGVDVSQCSLVLRFDPPLEYRSYIQSKGRARSAESSFVLMVARNDMTKFLKNYQSFQLIEQKIHRILVGNTDTRDAPTRKEIQELYEEDILPPFVTPQGGRLPSVAAISLLNRYLSTIPHDQFTHITPAWIHEIVSDGHNIDKRLITIIFPLTCPIKEPIKGTPQITLKNAKRSAALAAIVKLHELGELDSTTLLPKTYGVVDFEEDDVKECFLNWPWEERADEQDKDLPKPGSKKCVRKHRLAFPNCLNAVPNSMRYYLHIIKLTTAFKKPTESREQALYDFIQADEGYGFLTQHPLPKLCTFPTFMTIGEVTTQIHMNYAVIDLNDAMINLIRRFHFFLFDQVLMIAKKFAVFEGKVNCLYVVPLKGDHGYDIDWDIIQKYTQIPPVEAPDVTTRRSIRVTQEAYKHKVVSPWYRGTIMPDRYIVSNVLEYLSPKSFLNTASEQTYADYYSSKYNLEIMGQINQPLLEVRNISSRMNCLLPRAATINTLTEKQAKQISLILGDDKPKGGFSEVFVAEFCIKYEFPGVMWFKASMLPSIIHRLHMMLVAQELIMAAAQDIQYGTAVLPSTYDYESLAKTLGRDYTQSTRGSPAFQNNEEPPQKRFCSQLADSPAQDAEDSSHHLPDLINYSQIEQEWLPITVNMPIAVNSLLSHIEVPHNTNNSIDRIHQPIAPNSNQTIPKILSMKESLYQLQKNKIDSEYPWDESIEPMDVERNIQTATLLDINTYDDFVSVPMSPVKKTAVKFQKRVVPIHAAIKPPPLKYIEKINILQKKPTGRGPELRDVLSALTVINSHDSFCLERAETLGDSFLKFAATLYLYHKFSERNEGQLTNIKGRLISNRNLYYAGERLNIGGKMKVEPFAPRKDFLVPGFFAPKELQDFIEEKKIRPTFLIGTAFSNEEKLFGELDPESLEAVKQRYVLGDGLTELEPEGKAQNAMQCYLHSQAVSDKSVADCVEALIGTYLLSGGILAAVKIVEWMRIFPAKHKLAELLHKPVATIITEKKATENDVDFLMDYCRSSVEEVLGYKFKDPSFLLEALSHASFIRNRLTRAYERLEFLGDAILDFLITTYIFENSPDLKPGDLTNLRSALVNNVTFAAYVVKLGLHKYICKELNPPLDSAIMAFVTHQVARNHEIVEDVLYLIDEEECLMAEYVEVPKILSDVFESLAGAIFLDSGGDLETVWSVIYPIMCNEIYEFTMRIPRQPVAILSEMIHTCPEFGAIKLVDPDLPGVSKITIPVTFTKKDKKLTVHGIGMNKAQAKRAAAKLALKIINF